MAATSRNIEPSMNRCTIHRLMGFANPLSLSGDSLRTDGLYANANLPSTPTLDCPSALEETAALEIAPSVHVPPLVAEGIGCSVMKGVAIAMEELCVVKAVNEVCLLSSAFFSFLADSISYRSKHLRLSHLVQSYLLTIHSVLTRGTQSAAVSTNGPTADTSSG